MPVAASNKRRKGAGKNCSTTANRPSRAGSGRQPTVATGSRKASPVRPKSAPSRLRCRRAAVRTQNAGEPIPRLFEFLVGQRVADVLPAEVEVGAGVPQDGGGALGGVRRA